MTEPVLSRGSHGDRERDIDLVLITGAGASREFGVEGKKLPLMGDWSDAIMKKLFDKGYVYLKATGLQRGMSGEQFEAQLGRFLRQVAAFPLIESLLEVSTEFPGVQTALRAQGVLTEWHRQVRFGLGQAVEGIRETLYEEFGENVCNTYRAGQVYGKLFEALRLSRATRWVYATTNYDMIGEAAIEGSGALPDWGQPPRTARGGDTPIDVSNILGGMPRYVPVLHLHGRIGWYRRTDPVGTVTPSPYAAPVVKHDPGYGVPIVMLPDPDKVYDTDDIITALWMQFTEALQRAKAVLVLGHSLNDRVLLDAITRNVEPLDRVGVTVLADANNPGEPDPGARNVRETVQSRLPTAEIIPLRFGATDEATSEHGIAGIEKWVQDLADKGFR